MLDQEEYIEQAYFFRVLSERLPERFPLQELMGQIRHELLATTKLPMAVDYLLTELKHTGVMATGMHRLSHYFTPYQTYIVTEAENERGRFDMRIAIEILRFEAEYRAKNPTPQGMFMYQFETICRNRLRYDHGLYAIACDPIYDEDWRKWILTVRRQIGLVDFADLIFVRSEECRRLPEEMAEAATDGPAPKFLFGRKEGKIALANRQKDPVYLFAALQRHLGYPMAPRLKKPDESREIIPQMARRIERLETRIKLLEEENRQGIDITKFYAHDDKPAQ